MNRDTLFVTEIFQSIQGETTFTGVPCSFIRLSGCHLRCSWCDTPYSFKQGTPYTIDAILAEMKKLNNSLICITGGEPLLQKRVYPLMEKLLSHGYTLLLETNGALSIKDVPEAVHIILDVKCPSSKMSEKNDSSNLENIPKNCQIKFVIANLDDYQFAKAVIEKFHLKEKNIPLLFSAASPILDPKALISWILEDKLSVRYNCQLHKIIWGQDAKGV